MNLITIRVVARVVASLVAGCLVATTLMAATSDRDIKALDDQSYIYVATVRKDGNQSRAVRVWFLTNADHQILIDTNSDSWKAKRIRRGSPVMVWIGSATGPAFVGKAEIVNDNAVHDQMIAGIPQKYYLAKLGFFGPNHEKFDSGKVITIRITPVRDLPDGFQSQPGTPAPQLLPESEFSPRVGS